MLWSPLQDADAICDHFHVDLHLLRLTVSWLCHIQGEQRDRHHADIICPTYGQNYVCWSVLQLHIFLYHGAYYNGDRLRFWHVDSQLLGERWRLELMEKWLKMMMNGECCWGQYFDKSTCQCWLWPNFLFIIVFLILLINTASWVCRGSILARVVFYIFAI